MLANTIGNMIKPANKAIKVSHRTIIIEVLKIDSCSSRYAPYMTTQPMPKLNVKKAWPIATSIVEAVIIEKSGLNKKDTPSENYLE